jgi:preprotein translocase subunit SecF
VVDARVSGEFFRNGLLATALALFARIRENLAKFRTMPLREIIDLSINRPSAAPLPHR